MTLSEHIYNFTDYQPWPDESEINIAIEHLADMSIEQFSKQNILQCDAEALALADESFVQHCASLVPIDFDSIDEHIKSDKYAYHLAYSNPELATQLLDELLYYRSLNRI